MKKKLPTVKETLQARLDERGYHKYEAAEQFGRGRSWANQELFANPEKVLRGYFSHSPEKLNKFAKWLGWQNGMEMLVELGLMDSVGLTSSMPEHIRTARNMQLENLRQEQVGTRRLAVYAAGAGPVISDSDVDGEIDVEVELLDRYPGLVPFRIMGSCMEPDYPEGWIALIVPDAAYAAFGTDVLVWFSDDGRAIKRLIESREDGTHILLQTNPPSGEGRIIQCAFGSTILGVVIDVRRGSRPRVNKRELYDAIQQEMPELLETV